MRYLTTLVVAALLLTAAGCGGSPPTQSARQTGPSGLASRCATKAGGHRAFMVVTHANGANRLSCADFTSDAISGADLMQRSGIPFQTAARSYGLAVCKVDGEPADAPGCIPPGAPYWSIWTGSTLTGWQFSTVSVGKVMLHDGESLGVHYVAQGGTPQPPSSAPVELGS